MSDVDPLAARWLETRDPEDEARYLEALRAAGRLRRASVEVAAWLGDAVARDLLGPRAGAFAPQPTLATYLDLLPGDEAIKGQAALAVLTLVAEVAPERAAAHPIGQRVLRALDCDGEPSVERLLTARAAARRTVDALWPDLVTLGHDCLGAEHAERLAEALRARLLPWALVRPDPGGDPLEGLSRVPAVFAPEAMTPGAARAVLSVPASHPYDSAEGKEVVQDYLVALGWKRDVSGIVGPAGAQKLKFDMTARRLVLQAKRDGRWAEAWDLPLFLAEVAGRLVLQAEDALRDAGEAPPTKRLGRVRRRKAGEPKKRAAWTAGGPPTLAQLDQIAELQRGTSDAGFAALLRRVADVESVGDLRRETAGKVILALSGFE